jgi:hypothetical protein
MILHITFYLPCPLPGGGIIVQETKLKYFIVEGSLPVIIVQLLFDFCSVLLFNAMLFVRFSFIVKY